MKKYTVDYFIKKFSAIPAIRWTTGQYKKGDKYCAYGHCGLREARCGYDRFTNEGNALYELMDQKRIDVAELNDGQVSRYLQKTPKARILAALKDIKKLNN